VRSRSLTPQSAGQRGGRVADIHYKADIELQPSYDLPAEKHTGRFFNRVCDEMDTPKVIVDDVDPPLTTVSLPLTEMGKTASQLLIDQINREGQQKIIIKMLKGELVIRESA